jgi:hypothetical protein
MMLKERRPKGGRKGEGGVRGEIIENQKAGESIKPGKDEVVGKAEKTENDDKSGVQKSNERNGQEDKVEVEK